MILTNCKQNGKITHLFFDFNWSIDTLANSAQAKKRARQAEKSRQHNTSLRSKMRTMIKAVRESIDKKDKKAAADNFKRATKTMDNMVNKGISHANTIARYKSRLNKAIKSLG